MKPRIICTAQPFAFGPASKLVAIAEQCKPWADLVFIGNGTALQFAEMNSGLFQEIREVEKASDVLNTRLHGSNAVLSVMEPWAVLQAARHEVPVIYVDSLNWMSWKPDPYRRDREKARALLTATDADLVEFAASTPDSPELTRTAYHWADDLCFQGVGDPSRWASDLPDASVHQVGAIVPTRAGALPVPKHGDPFISLSGTLSRLVPAKVATKYLRIVGELMRRNRGMMPGVKVAGHPFSTELMSRLGWNAQPLAQREMQDMMRSSGYILAPAGLTTALEAAAARTPMGILPETEYSHFSNYERLTSSDPDAFPAIRLNEHLMLPSDPTTDDFERLYDYLLSSEGEKSIAGMSEAMGSVIRELSSPSGELVERQSSAILDIFGNFEGARDVAAITADVVREARRTNDRDAAGAFGSPT